MLKCLYNQDLFFKIYEFISDNTSVNQCWYISMTTRVQGGIFYAKWFNARATPFDPTLIIYIMIND